MFFRRKGRLRKEFDEKLLNQLHIARENRQKQNTLVERSFEPTKELICEAKIAELKYFYLIREAKSRKLSLRS